MTASTSKWSSTRLATAWARACAGSSKKATLSGQTQDDGVEVFQIKKQRWVKTWRNQPFPVRLVIGVLPEDSALDRWGDKRQFENICWMEINSVLKQLRDNGTKPVTQIEFHGEEVNMTTVMQQRKGVMGGVRSEHWQKNWG